MATERDVLDAARALRDLDAAFQVAERAATEAADRRDTLKHQRVVAANKLTGLVMALDRPSLGREFI